MYYNLGLNRYNIRLASPKYRVVLRSAAYDMVDVLTYKYGTTIWDLVYDTNGMAKHLPVVTYSDVIRRIAFNLAYMLETHSLRIYPKTLIMSVINTPEVNALDAGGLKIQHVSQISMLGTVLPMLGIGVHALNVATREKDVISAFEQKLLLPHYELV